MSKVLQRRLMAGGIVIAAGSGFLLPSGPPRRQASNAPERRAYIGIYLPSPKHEELQNLPLVPDTLKGAGERAPV